MAVREIVSIDAELCNGCGDCIPNCAEGAIRVIDGTAVLLNDILCDGLGACLGVCPEDAITIMTRQAPAFDEVAVREHLAKQWTESAAVRPAPHAQPHAQPQGGCPSSSTPPIRLSDMRAPAPQMAQGPAPTGPSLPHWPIKLELIPPDAPFLRGADLMLVADCAPFARPEIREEFTSDTAVMIGCPKSDDYESAVLRLAEILRRSDARSLTVVHMEVPCCSGYWYMSQQAMEASGKSLPLRKVIVGVRGDVSAPIDASA
ncbi:4Fe-4S ferredoxin [Candidatus Poribacteria bacterium]|nr:4Fe-4S ferredoxin [Candidatus Poribacteria bacterium]MBT5531745.1 4Fe-4S ferredoxin [Candidatus Poribacteria bacterium]MBT5710079.1 4Fe-4S ferredoxin [Candidatus Poribacteria bacterium]MBT7099057.1 4Fe-4S ferredoxin [Candidatus Poribacteria bacterium]MBT7805164.1 4Fe-4S ferredoxin [Candidatus Poribacteria bacterium]